MQPPHELFVLKKELVLGELRGHGVRRLLLHPGGRRLLVLTDSPVRNVVMIDLRQGIVMHDYSGSDNIGKNTG